jgi:hypothetical protein
MRSENGAKTIFDPRTSREQNVVRTKRSSKRKKKRGKSNFSGFSTRSRGQNPVVAGTRSFSRFSRAWSVTDSDPCAVTSRFAMLSNRWIVNDTLFPGRFPYQQIRFRVRTRIEQHFAPTIADLVPTAIIY